MAIKIGPDNSYRISGEGIPTSPLKPKSVEAADTSKVKTKEKIEPIKKQSEKKEESKPIEDGGLFSLSVGDVEVIESGKEESEAVKKKAGRPKKVQTEPEKEPEVQDTWNPIE